MKKDIYIEEKITELVFSSDGITLPYCKILEKHGSKFDILDINMQRVRHENFAYFLIHTIQHCKDLKVLRT